MAAVEIILLVCGIICIVVSFIFDFGEKAKEGEAITTELTEEQKEKIKEQITQLIDEELANLNEKTEASLDKISNTKILELNDYAENILGQINRNHNETVFLYDMLNEKAKEVKNTVRDVNVARQEVELLQHRVGEYSEEYASTIESIVGSDAAEATETTVSKEPAELKDQAKERLAELVRKNNEQSRKSGAAKKNQAKQLDEMVAGEETQQEKPVRKTTRRTSAAKKETSVQKEASAATASTAAKEGSASPKRTTRKTAAKKVEAQAVAQEAANMNIQFDKGANNNDKILKLYSLGVSNKDIAKQLNLGVGEVKLVIDLYNGGK